MAGWFKNPLELAEGLLDQVDKRVSSVVGSAEKQPVPPQSAATESSSPPAFASGWDHHLSPAKEKSSKLSSPAKSPARTRSGSTTVKLPPRKLSGTPPNLTPQQSLNRDPLETNVAGDLTKKPAVPDKPTSTVPVSDTVLPHGEQSERTASGGAEALSGASCAEVSTSSHHSSDNGNGIAHQPQPSVASTEPAQQPTPRKPTEIKPQGSSDGGGGWLSKTEGLSDSLPAPIQAQPAAVPVSPSSTLRTLPRPPPKPNSTASTFKRPQPPAVATSDRTEAPQAPQQSTAASAAPVATQPPSTSQITATSLKKPLVSDDALREPATDTHDQTYCANGNGAHPGSSSHSSSGNGHAVEDDPVSATDVGSSSEHLQQRLATESAARAAAEATAARLREDLTAAKGRAAVAEAALAEARDLLSTAEDRAAAAEATASSAGGAADTARSAVSAAEERAAAAQEAAATARARAREAAERADLKADALRSCEARLGVVEGELEEAVAGRDSAVAEAAKLREQASKAAERAAQEGTEQLASLQQELAAAREAAEAANAEVATERAAATETRVTADRRLQAMEGALGIAHAEASQSARAAEDAVEALEASEARNATLEQRLAEVSAATAAARDDPATTELQSRLEESQARCQELQHTSHLAKQRVEELEREASEARASGAHLAVQDLQAQVKQANQLLVERQSLWERSAAEHAAKTLTLERQLAQAQEKLVVTRQGSGGAGGSGRSGSGSGLLHGDDVVPMDSLHGYYKFASHRRFGKAVKAFGGTVDSITAQVVSVLRRNPLARILVLIYVFVVHVLIYLLLGRMQHHAAMHPGSPDAGTLSRFDTPTTKMRQQP